MKLIRNAGSDRVLDVALASLAPRAWVDFATPELCLYAWGELRTAVQRTQRSRIVLATTDLAALAAFGRASDRSWRNRLQTRWLAAELARWLRERCELRIASGPVQQASVVVSRSEQPVSALTGSCGLSTVGLGLAPSTGFQLVQSAEGPEELSLIAGWFQSMWNALPPAPVATREVLARLDEIAGERAPSLVYAGILQAVFGTQGDDLDEDRVIRAGTGIKDTLVWKKLYRFQRDGVVGAIDKLERYGGCIIADSVGLGKTFEALAVIKYYELRNNRVLVLCPKRLRDNWTVYRANDRRNILAQDRLNYDVLNHTDLSRDAGTSGDIDLAQVNWGNYDLVVIDESHNFRNKAALKGRETRYDRLMRRIIQEGVKTRVLMLSATPVNNRLADLKNQIAFATEAKDDALGEHGVASIETTTRLAQGQFNKWLKRPEAERSAGNLIEMLGFDYFKLLDLLTIARSRKHIERYYGTSETGRFPERMRPINIKAEVDSAGEFKSIRDINKEIRRLNLSVYAPLRYVLPHKKAAYDAMYSVKVRGGSGSFKQADREESLIHLMRVNVLKRMESAVTSFIQTLERQLADVETMLGRVDGHEERVDEIDIADVNPDDPVFESLLVGRKVQVLLQDVDRIKWRQDLNEDRDRLRGLLEVARKVDASRDAKLAALKAAIEAKVKEPLNPGNRKVLVFTAFADTAHYLYEQVSTWAKDTLGLNTGVVTGSGRNHTSLPGLRTDMGSILSAFSPRSKERSSEFAGEGEIDLLIATDCISEGQNLQDCDTLVNYDIHWNPVRIIQRFGRIDRLGSSNARIQLINFWPNIELEEYINLEQRVTGRMVLLDVSATGEENLIEQAAGDPMNDLEYRRKQLLKLQESVVDLEDVGAGLSIADLTLTDFRIDLARARKEHGELLARLPPGVGAVVRARPEDGVEAGVFFCLRAEGAATKTLTDRSDPLAPHALVHVGEGGVVRIPHTQAKVVLDRLKRLCAEASEADLPAWGEFDQATLRGERMEGIHRPLATAVASIVGKTEERAVASLFSPGGTHALKGEFAGVDDFEVVAFVRVLPMTVPS